MTKIQNLKQVNDHGKSKIISIKHYRKNRKCLGWNPRLKLIHQ